MTRLLVSVRSLDEARLAVEAGVDLIDLKEPDRGSLGAVDDLVAREIIRWVDGRVPLSAALGELCDGQSFPVPNGLKFAKFGLAGCQTHRDWPGDWAEAISRLPSGTAPVAVIYADWARAAAPEPQQVIHHAQRLKAAAVLVDTCCKSYGDLLLNAPLSHVQDWVSQARSAGMLSVLAGSLSPRTVGRVLAAEPDYVAVRGAVCRGSRRGTIDAGLVRAMVGLVRQQRPRFAAPFA